MGVWRTQRPKPRRSEGREDRRVAEEKSRWEGRRRREKVPRPFREPLENSETKFLL